MIIKKLIYLLIISFNFTIFSYSNEVKIVAKVNNDIITNVDLENQKKYLLIFNKNLKNLNREELTNLSKNSLIKETIKHKEIDKFFKLENSNLGENLIEDTFLSLGYKSKKEFLIFLKNQKLEYDILKKKLILEKLWNTLIFEKYKKKVKVNEIEVRKKVKFFFDNNLKKYELNISEIIFSNRLNYDEIIEYIDKFSFENAAVKYSISDTSSKGGKIGWVNPENLTKEIKNKVLELKIGETTKPLKIPNGHLILKLNSKRKIKNAVNLEEEIKKQINYENNRQLKSFSLNHYNKIKKNTLINEY